VCVPEGGESGSASGQAGGTDEGWGVADHEIQPATTLNGLDTVEFDEKFSREKGPGGAEAVKSQRRNMPQ